MYLIYDDNFFTKEVEEELSQRRSLVKATCKKYVYKSSESLFSTKSCAWFPKCPETGLVFWIFIRYGHALKIPLKLYKKRLRYIENWFCKHDKHVLIDILVGQDFIAILIFCTFHSKFKVWRRSQADVLWELQNWVCLDFENNWNLNVQAFTKVKVFW